MEAEAGQMRPQPGDPSRPRSRAGEGGFSGASVRGWPSDPRVRASGLQDCKRINPCPLL